MTILGVVIDAFLLTVIIGVVLAVAVSFLPKSKPDDIDSPDGMC